MLNEVKKKITRRLDVLDGLRGVAMLMVFFNHVDSYFVIQAVPPVLQQFVSFFFLSGKLGLSFFFILSGFLMAYLYANPVPMEFIERRYARIFPPFISMVLCMSIFRLFPSLPLLMRIAAMLGMAYVLRIIWIYFVEKYHKGDLLIKVFLFFQLGVALWYGFFIMRKPPIWFDSLPFFIKQATITATNATLTLPLGDYIPMIDGVYWSLIPEVIFYLIYPFIFAPTVQRLKTKSFLFISGFILSLFPFFFGISFLFMHVRNFRMLFIEYFIYFCVGIFVAVLAKNKERIILPPVVKKLFNPYAIFFILLLTHFNLTNTQGVPNLISRLLWSIPFGCIVYGLLDEDTSLARFFTRKSFVFLGTISYAMYISHTAIVDGMHLLFRPTNALSTILFLILTTIVFIITAYGIHRIIETPYFMFKPHKKNGVVHQISTRFVYLSFLLFFMFIFFTSYSSQYNFFSLQKKYTNSIPATIPISQIPYTFSFTAQEDNMGVLLVHLTNAPTINPPKTVVTDPLIHQRFQIKMKEKGATSWYASQSTDPAEIGNSTSYPFGFPSISNSKNKIYIVEMSIKDIDYRSTVLFNKDTYDLTTVHQIPKQALLKNPIKLLSHISEKVKTILSDREARLVAVCISPFFLLLFFLLYT